MKEKRLTQIVIFLNKRFEDKNTIELTKYMQESNNHDNADNMTDIDDLLMNMEDQFKNTYDHEHAMTELSESFQTFCDDQAVAMTNPQQQQQQNFDTMFNDIDDDDDEEVVENNEQDEVDELNFHFDKIKIPGCLGSEVPLAEI